MTAEALGVSEEHIIKMRKGHPYYMVTQSSTSNSGTEDI